MAESLAKAESPLALDDPSISSSLQDDSAVQSFLDVLEQHRTDCERQGKYEEADLANSRLEQLRSHEESRRREELHSQQLSERLGVEEAHMKELQEFNTMWDSKVAEFEAHAANLQSTLSLRHQEEHKAFLDKAQRETAPRAPRWSKELLNLRKIQESLAKQKNYSEAAKVKAQNDQIQAKETAAWKAKRDTKVASLDDQFIHKQSLEMGGLLKRIHSGREEQKHARKTELERLQQRYHNVKTQMESQQTIIRQRAEKFAVSGVSQFSTLSMSRPGSRVSSRLGAASAVPALEAVSESDVRLEIAT